MSETRTISAAELFLKIGTTPRTRSVRADQLFRRLRQGDTANVAAKIASGLSQEKQTAPSLQQVAARTFPSRSK